MSKISSIEKNNSRARKAEAFKSKRNDLKNKIMDRTLDDKERFIASCKLAKMPRNSAKTRIRFRCEITGRSRGFYRKFKMSRIALRQFALQGMVPGVTKASW